MKFKGNESVREAVQRVAKRRIQKATRALKRCERLEAVHEVRKDIKQLRALLRLVRPVLPRSAYRRYTASFQDAAGCLSNARDAHVKLNALVELTNHFKPELGPGSFGQLKKALAESCQKQQENLARRHVPRRVSRILEKAGRHLTSFKLRASGWRALKSGLKRTYRDGKRSFDLVQKTGSVANLHEWRKRVKDLYYQMELLCPMAPNQLAAAVADLKRLGEFLGDDHDLSMLIESSTIKRLKQIPPHELEVIQGLATERQKELRQQAIILGTRYYEEKPSAFCKRLGRYWKRWRDHSKRVAKAKPS